MELCVEIAQQCDDMAIIVVYKGLICVKFYFIDKK